MFIWKRTLRTESSERFLALENGKEVAAADIHYLASGHVAGTLIVLREAGLGEDRIQELLRTLDEDMLPGVDVESGSLTYTVVVGDVVGNFEASKQP
jgi:hypothetical protein